MHLAREKDDALSLTKTSDIYVVNLPKLHLREIRSTSIKTLVEEYIEDI